MAKMRMSEFETRMSERFGTYAESLLADLVLPQLRATGAQALARGIDPRDVWRAVCEVQDVPERERA